MVNGIKVRLQRDLDFLHCENARERLSRADYFGTDLESARECDFDLMRVDRHDHTDAPAAAGLAAHEISERLESRSLDQNDLHPSRGLRDDAVKGFDLLRGQAERVTLGANIDG